MFLHRNHGAGGGNGSIMVGMFVCLCLASKNSSEREVFVPARTDLAVKLLNPLMVALDNFAEGRPPLQRYGFIKSMPLEGWRLHHHGEGVCVVSDL